MMNQHVPSWEVEENLALSNNITSLPLDVSTFDYELTWKDGKLEMHHGFGAPELPFASGTLESLVNQATTSRSGIDAGDELIHWYNEQLPSVPASSISVTINNDALMSPCINNQESLPVIGAGFNSTSSGSPGNTMNTAKDPVENHHVSACKSKKQRKDDKEEDKKKIAAKSAEVHNLSERKRREKINQKMETLKMLVPNACKNDKVSMLDEVIEYMKHLQAISVQMQNRMNMSTMMFPLALQQQLQMSMMSPMGMAMGMGLGVMDMNAIMRPNLSRMLPPQQVLHPNPFMPMTYWDVPADRMPPPPNLSRMLPPQQVLHPNPFMPMTPWDVPADRMPPPSTSLAPPSSSMPDPLAASFLACKPQSDDNGRILK